MYGIKWESKITGYVGQGQCVYTKHDVQKICNKYNVKHSNIEYEVISDKE